MWKRVLGDTNYENLRRVEKEVGAKRFRESEDRAKRQELMDETVDIICRSVRDLFEGRSYFSVHADTGGHGTIIRFRRMPPESVGSDTIAATKREQD